eukprot:jgi/Picre1/33558/NNA_008879.t1
MQLHSGEPDTAWVKQAAMNYERAVREKISNLDRRIRLRRRSKQLGEEQQTGAEQQPGEEPQPGQEDQQLTEQQQQSEQSSSLDRGTTIWRGAAAGQESNMEKRSRLTSVMTPGPSWQEDEIGHQVPSP